MFLAAIEGTIVATAMPSIAAKLGGFALYSWVFSSYLLMQAVMTPIFGKLADLYGRKPVFLAGIALFLLGSVLCGFVSSMEMLIVFRLLQGVGAGACADQQHAGRRPHPSRSAGGCRARSPACGGSPRWWVRWRAGSSLDADWHWIFWLNVPFGLVAMLMIVLFLHEDVRHEQRSMSPAPRCCLWGSAR